MFKHSFRSCGHWFILFSLLTVPFKGAARWRRSWEDEAGLRQDDCLWFVYGFLFCGSSVPAKIIHHSLQHSRTLPHRFPSHSPRTLRSGPQGTSEGDRLLQSFEDRIPSWTKQEVPQEYKLNKDTEWECIHCTQNHSLIHNPCRSLLHQTLHKCAWGESCWVSWFRPAVQMYSWDQISARWFFSTHPV